MGHTASDISICCLFNYPSVASFTPPLSWRTSGKALASLSTERLPWPICSIPRSQDLPTVLCTGQFFCAILSTCCELTALYQDHVCLWNSGDSKCRSIPATYLPPLTGILFIVYRLPNPDHCLVQSHTTTYQDACSSSVSPERRSGITSTHSIEKATHRSYVRDSLWTDLYTCCELDTCVSNYL